jgi:hypothetical protein
MTRISLPCFDTTQRDGAPVSDCLAYFDNIWMMQRRFMAPNIVVPHEEFRACTEAEIEQALADPDPANPIAIELVRLMNGYTENFKAHVKKLGRIPPDIMHITPRWPIEAAAMRLTKEAISAALHDKPPEG